MCFFSFIFASCHTLRCRSMSGKRTLTMMMLNGQLKLQCIAANWCYKLFAFSTLMRFLQDLQNFLPKSISMTFHTNWLLQCPTETIKNSYSVKLISHHDWHFSRSFVLFRVQVSKPRVINSFKICTYWNCIFNREKCEWVLWKCHFYCVIYYGCDGFSCRKNLLLSFNVVYD